MLANLSLVVRVACSPWRKNVVLPVLLVLVTAAFEFTGLLVMGIISDFYSSVVALNRSYFTRALLRAVGTVLLIAVLKSVQTLAQEACALQWRCTLVAALHRGFFANFDLKIAKEDLGDEREEGAVPTLADSDQRMTQDTERLATSASLCLATIFIKPCVLLFYTVYLCFFYGWYVPALCYAFFFAGALLSLLCSRPLVPTVARQEQREGLFRYQHATLRLLRHSIALYGPPAFATEKHRADSLYLATYANQRRLLLQNLVLNLSTNGFAYLGSIVSYAVIGNALLVSNAASPMDSADVAAAVARGSYACLALISAFSDLNALSEQLAYLLGYCDRVADFLRPLLPPPSPTKAALAGVDVEPQSESDDGADEIERQTLLPLAAACVFCCQRTNGGKATLVLTDLLENEESLVSPLMHAAASDGPATPTRSRSSMDDGGGVWTVAGASVMPLSLPLSLAPTEDLVRIRGLSLVAPDSRLLVSDLDLALSPGQRLLVCGPSGCGKTTLMRALSRALWAQRAGPAGSEAVSVSAETEGGHEQGSIAFAAGLEAAWVPQQSYLFFGSLRDNLLYPGRARGDGGAHGPEGDAAMVAALRAVRLGHLLDPDPPCADPLSCERDWALLTPGERQRVDFARLLLRVRAGARLCVLDEGSSAVDAAEEARLYGLLLEAEGTGGAPAAGLGLVSFGHRESLRAFHTHLLALGGGEWQLSSLPYR